MTSPLLQRITSLRLGTPQRHHNLTVFPLLANPPAEPDYILLAEALEKDLLSVEEVDEGGSVPDLRVTNKSDCRVLMLDGEELIGAKQNRVLNTTILLDKRSKTVIPVSCTEQGRWAYTSREFSSSGHHLSSKARSRKTRSVSSSLRRTSSYHSDQGEVWSEISKLHASSGTTSPTSAMRDAYEQRKEELKEYEQAFTVDTDQCGALFCIDSKPAGLDLFSVPPAYSKLHCQLIRSYAVDAFGSPSKNEDEVALDAAGSFLHDLESSQGEVFDSTGLGREHRLEQPHAVGSALLVDDTVIHTAFFALDDEQAEGSEPSQRHMSSSRHRRAYRSHRQPEEQTTEEASEDEDAA